MEDRDKIKFENRRQFLRGIGRCGVAIGIGIGMAMLEIKRRRLVREGKCVNRGVCGECEVFSVCKLPAAVTLKDKK